MMCEHEFLEPGYSYTHMRCPGCDKEIWVENIGIVTAIVTEDKRNLKQRMGKWEELNRARDNVIHSEKIMKANEEVVSDD